MHALLISWLELTELASDGTTNSKQRALIEPVALHLKELSASNETSSTFVAFMTSQMASLTKLL